MSVPSRLASSLDCMLWTTVAKQIELEKRKLMTFYKKTNHDQKRPQTQVLSNNQQSRASCQKKVILVECLPDANIQAEKHCTVSKNRIQIKRKLNISKTIRNLRGIFGLRIIRSYIIKFKSGFISCLWLHYARKRKIASPDCLIWLVIYVFLSAKPSGFWPTQKFQLGHTKIVRQ